VKNWIMLQIAGPLGAIIRPIIAAILGVIIGLFYEQVWIGIYKVAWLRFFAERVIASLPSDVVHSLTPSAIGAVAAVGAWAGISSWIINQMKSGNRQIQHTLNATPAAANVSVDGIILKHGETAASISRLAYEALYPEDTLNRGGNGMPEIRKPLP
tara:strand:+ start:1311 stop:1778 length:468 start_codon:yes stop_codon:yes gene_type:complete